MEEDGKGAAMLQCARFVLVWKVTGRRRERVRGSGRRKSRGVEGKTEKKRTSAEEKERLKK